MKNSLKKRILVPLVVLIVLTLVGTAAATPGTSTGPAPLRQLATIILPDPLNVMDTETGNVSLSTDGMGVNTGAANDIGTIRVDKPAGATVRKAFLMSATTGFSGYVLASGDVLLNGNDVFPWDATTASSISSNNYWKDVTSIVKPVVDAAPAGIVNFEINESNGKTGLIDGEALAVIFNDSAQATNTVVLLFGAQNVAGDTFNVLLGKPADFTDPNFGIGFGLGISFGYQTPSVTVQFSNVTVNGNLLSSSAGGQDDGAALNGALITVGGIGDLPNPILPLGCGLDPRCDTERYMLSPPFVNNGDTAIKVDTLNPSNDDNIFFAWFNITNSTAIVTEGGSIGSISGMKFNDINHNGVMDIGELGLANWNINLTNESGGVVTNITDASGNYNFTDLADGNYTVGETIQPGWVETMPGISPTGSVTYKVEIKNGNQVTDKDFGNFFDIPSASCVKGPNPSSNIPVAKGGQRPDGFYTLIATDPLNLNLQIFVKDMGSGTVFPFSPPGFANGTNIKYTQAPGATPSIVPFSGVVAWHITGTGDAAVYAVNSVGNPSPSVSCLVPPPPK